MFSYERLKDPGYFREKRLDAHSDHVAYASREEMESGESSLYMPLNGVWKFFYARNEAQIIPNFEAADYDCRSWTEIPVPAHIQMQGFGVPQYCNIQYPWDGHEEVPIGEIPNAFNPVACYVKYFYVPESLRGKRLFISFQGVESCVAVWLNGKYIGFSSDSFTPHEFELTDALEDGENKLACRVYRFCAGSWIEDQDFMRFSGIFRDVWLYAIPETHIRDLRVKTLLDDDYRDATLDLRLRVEGKLRNTLNLCLSEGGKTVAVLERDALESEMSFQIPISDPKKWSAEHPNLYDLTIGIRNSDGETVEIVRQRVGFRRFEIKGGVMCLNGRRIVFKGVNRHDFCAETGRAVSPETIRRDLITMKRGNINAVRTCHYPDHSALYTLCDELGLYVIDETNMESHGVMDMVQRGLIPLSELLPGDRMEWKDILLDRVDSVYQRDKNHAAVLIWSVGNESMGGRIPYEMSRRFHELDDTRLVHYESISYDRRYEDTTDMESRMYTPQAKIREFLATRRNKPFILCEYTHAMGNSCGAMRDYTEYAYEEPLYQGGFVWDFIDQSLLTRDRFGRPAYLYGGDFGDAPNDGNFCGDGLVYGDGRISPKMWEVKRNYQNIEAVVTRTTARILNRSMFTDTSEYDCVAILERNGARIAETRLETSVPPMCEKEYPLPFPEQRRGGEYAVTLSFRLKRATAWAEAGYEIAFAQGIYNNIEETVPRKAHTPLKIVRGVWNFGIQGEDFEALFSFSGGLVSYKYCGQEMLKGTPTPNFWRAPTDNDRGNFMPQRYAQWKIASMYATHRFPTDVAARNGGESAWINDDGSASFRMVYALPTSPAAECVVRYTVHPYGRIDVCLEYDPVSGLSEMPEFGMLLRMDADFDRIRWYGLGPKENYADRNAGARLGIWETTARENLAHYLIPQECGNRTGVRWAEVTNAHGHGLRFIGDRMEFSALPFTPHELENALHEYELPPVSYTVVRCAKMQMGVGGDDSWGARTHEAYLIDVSKKLSFSFSFEGF